MELRINDYYRTKYGINKLREDACVLDDIIKSSPNIIDLIEVGDYVNGMEVTRIAGTYYGRKDKAIYCEHNGNENWKQVMIYDDEIKSIVTKEQFKSIKYEVN